jgi:hypothetical protein
MKNKDFKDLLTSIDQARKIYSGKRKKVKLTGRAKLMVSLMRRIRLLENAGRLYEQNPNLPQNVRIANRVLVDNDIDRLKKLLDILSK